MTAAPLPNITCSVLEATSLSSADIHAIHAVFAENYREANLAHLEKNLGKLRNVALARTEDGSLAGFALGELRHLDLPRLPNQPVRMAGLCCVSMAHRRRGLFGTLEGLTMREPSLPPGTLVLSSGRVAHPASYRGMGRNPTAVPRRGVPFTPWQQEVGIAIAEAYGSPGFDPATFVVKGSGIPIGFPVIEIEAEPEEWDLFKPVDRSKGDSLLALAWSPTAPQGW